ncbi:DUF1059 domain-containing protein [Halobium palmae]|uniref:DUF1059 domain-containing protein n=1 Tax=Halobium palmae TaxID=1776492 RepID=A0ABD5RZC1_9EURY
MNNEYACTQEGCTFTMRSEDEGEVIHMVREHAENRHGMSITDKDVRKGMTRPA